MKVIYLNILIIPFFIIAVTGCSGSSQFNGRDNAPDDSLLTDKEVGAKVFILMNNGDEYKGELLRVRDSKIVLCKKYEASEEAISEYIYPFYSLKNRDIKLIELVAENYPIVGILFGGLGAVMGAVIGSKYGRKQQFLDTGDADIGCCIGGSVGLLSGMIIGYNIEDDEIVYEYANPDTYDFTQLNIYSRYGGVEPDYLKEIK